MSDVTMVVRGLAGADDAERLERALTRLGAVREVHVDSEKGLLAVSFEGGEAEIGRIEDAVRDAGYEYEPSPGAREAGGD